MNIVKITDEDIILIKTALEYCIKTNELHIKDKSTPKLLREAAKDVLKRNKITYAKIDKIYNSLFEDRVTSKDVKIEDINL